MPAQEQHEQHVAGTEPAEDELRDEDVDELLVEEVSIDGMCGVY